MLMNPVLEYAIEHQTTARAILISHEVPLDDVDDLCQEATMRILRANPLGCSGPATYWKRALRSVRVDYWRQHHRQPLPFSHSNGDGELVRDREDPAQDIDHQADVLEALRQAGEICRMTTPKERGAMTAHLQGERLNNAQRVRLHHLRKRLRAAVASPL